VGFCGCLLIKERKLVVGNVNDSSVEKTGFPLKLQVVEKLLFCDLTLCNMISLQIFYINSFHSLLFVVFQLPRTLCNISCL